ncbi:Tyrosine-protein phosphatase non-receptor type 4, partial [Operophtera brumata]
MIESVSRRAFSSTSGTYNVRASELARDRKLNIFNVTVQFLDETEHPFQIEKKAKGSVLLEQVFTHLELVEKDYFGLQFTESGIPPNAANSDTTRWLDSSKSVKKQVGVNAQLWLAVRFYPPEPSRLAEEYTRYLLCLQIRKLLLDGRITAPKNTALLLASFTVQAELGDYNVSEHPPNYLSELCLLPKQTTEDERKIRELHKLHSGQAPADAEANFLEHAKRLDCYGVESHPAKIRELHKLHSGWAPADAEANFLEHAKRLDCYGVESHPVKIRELHKLHSGQAPADAEANFLEHAKRLDCYGVESHPAKVCNIQSSCTFGIGSTSPCLVDYHGKDILIGVTSIGLVVFQNNIRINTFSWGKIVKISFKKKRFFIQLKREASESYDTVLGFNMRTSRAAKALWRCSVERHGFFRLRGPRRRPRSSSRHRSQSAGTASPTSNGAAMSCRGSRVTSQTEPAPRHAWTDAHSQPDLNNTDLLERVLRIPLTYVDESESASEPHDEAVCIHLSADAEGVFGFNVRGGGGAPVLVSRVASRTREQLQQGDQEHKGSSVIAIYETHNQETVTEEPAVCFVPLSSIKLEGDVLEQSMLLLGDGLANGAALTQYDTLQRRIPE